MAAQSAEALDAAALQKHVRGDRVTRAREEYRQCADPAFVSYGPKTQREFLNLRTWG